MGLCSLPAFYSNGGNGGWGVGWGARRGEAGKNVKPVLPGREYSVDNQDLKDIKKKIQML